jgi:putrescine aminotransferase
MNERIADRLLAEVRRRQAENFELHRRHVNPGFVELIGLAGYARRFVRATGVELEDDRGRRYLDFLSGYGALSLGHNSPAVRAAVAAVLQAELPGFTQVECSLLEGLAAERLASRLPGDLDTVFFCSSGSEAVEAALKLARAATGRRRILGCEGAYHGLTLGALGLLGDTAMREPFGPLIPGLERVPYDDDAALRRELGRGDVAAFVVEPVQGENGAVVPRPGYLARARELCSRHGTLLVVDEVQSGLGRTGRLLAVEHDGVVPDVVLLAKALGGGLMPVGAMVARGAVFRRAYGSLTTCMLHNTTFGGGPLAMAAVIATLEVIADEDLCHRAAELGQHLRARLRELGQRQRAIAEVRGIGLMLGVRFADGAGGWIERTIGPVGRAAGALFAQHVTLRLIDEHQIVTQVAGNAPAVLKVMPPLTVTREQCDRFVDALDAVLAARGHAAALAALAARVVQRRL